MTLINYNFNTTSRVYAKSSLYMEQLFVSNLSLTDSSANKTHYFVVASSAGDKIGLLNIKPYIRSLAYDI